MIMTAYQTVEDITVALTAIHDLTPGIQEPIEPESLAHLAQKTIRSFLPEVNTAIWWLDADTARLISGNPPPALTILPSREPEHLC